MSSLAEVRTHVIHSSKTKLVTADVFLARLTGHEQLVRADEPSANLLGLRDEQTGTRIVVPVEEFFSRSVRPALAN